MSVISVPRPSTAKGGGPPPSLPPLVAGDTLDQKTFHERYEAMPPGFRAELIGGVVYVASPVRLRHGRPYSNMVKWVAVYEDATPGVEALRPSVSVPRSLA
jgi:hypothetical protein